MPSSLIIVALAVAWLVVLVPMVARKRQEVARTADDALASRVVRSGARGAQREESAMADDAEFAAHDTEFADDNGELADDNGALAAEEAEFADDEAYVDAAEPSGRRYRPGRGGFDPRAAELAARAKYAFRQRVVLGLLVTIVITVVAAAALTPLLWWGTGAAGALLVGYLGYLRRQVRIENDIRQRRLARMAGAASAARRRQADDRLDDEYDRDMRRGFEPARRPEYESEYEPEYELADEEPMTLAGVERKPRPQPRAPRRNATVVDVEDEDPAFHELAEPGPPAYRRAVGE